MKTNVSIELDDGQRSALANWLDGNRTKRLATRKDVNDLVSGLVAGIVDQATKANQTGVEALDQPAFERLQRYGPNPDALKQNHPHKDLIERNIKKLGKNEHEAKSYWRGWTMRPFTNK